MKDKILLNLIKGEIKRQEEFIDLIPSENYTSYEILKVLGSILTNKYSEGYPKKRYYPGNSIYDKIEELTKKRALKFFSLSPKTWDANVQPYSGSIANFAILTALLKPGDGILSMSLTSGGHISHGHSANFSSKIFRVYHYTLDQKTERINYSQIEELAFKFKPKLIISGASSYPRKIMFKKIGEVAKKVGAYHLADISHISGLIASGFHPSPFPYSDVVMTTTQKILRGPRGAIIFSRKKFSSAINNAVFPGIQGGPHNNVIGAQALMFFENQNASYKKYCSQVLKNAKILEIELKRYGFKLVSGGTDNHLLLVDLRNKHISGLEAEKELEKVNILANRNVVFNDKNPYKPSGLRIGTPAVTTRGMKEKEMKIIAQIIFETLERRKSKKVLKERVLTLLKRFPLNRKLKVF